MNQYFCTIIIVVFALSCTNSPGSCGESRARMHRNLDKIHCDILDIETAILPLPPLYIHHLNRLGYLSMVYNQ